jgi:tetratricopeptide (TPR) repeat protein
LNVALGDSLKRGLATQPTQSLAAYDAVLRGKAAERHKPDPRQAIIAYEEAVALDSTYVEAWSQLAHAQVSLYASTPTPARAEAARRSAERALALAPGRPEGHLALGAYYGFVLKDFVRTLTEDSTALALAPGNATFLGYVGYDEFKLGRWRAARTHLERAIRLDPRSRSAVRTLGLVLRLTRRYPEAEHVLDHGLQLEPVNLGVREQRAMVALAQGDLAGAQAVIKAAPKEVEPTDLVAFMGTYEDLAWVLDHVQLQLLKRLRPSAFGDDRATWGLVLTQTYALQGDTANARIYADSARVAFESQLVDAPEDAESHALLGLMLAYRRQKAEAIRQGKRGVALMPISRFPDDGTYMHHLLARIYVLLGEPEQALEQLELLLNVPSSLSSGWLKIDPNFAPLRGNPRFERLVNGS